MSVPEFVVASHRGPFVYEQDGDALRARRGGGGLIGSIGPAVEGRGAIWIAAPMSDGDRVLAKERPDGFEESGFTIRILDLPPEQHHLHYEVMSNEVFWFLFHYLFDTTYEPRFDGVFEKAWDAYRAVNAIYGEAIARTPGRTVLVNDYQLMLAGAAAKKASRSRRPMAYFHHTPWCEPEYFSLLPEGVRQQLIESMLAYEAIGFHSQRWADAFLRCCERFAPKRRRQPKVFIAPVPVDAERITRAATSEEVASWVRSHDELRGDRKLLLRVDRVDLSKNPLRGFLAFEHLLERRPGLADEVLFLALLYPSRQTVARYQTYYSECLGAVRRVNERYSSEPIHLLIEDDYQRSLGALRLYDALLVNPVFDGLNLVCKEGAVVNERAGSVILSRNAGAYEELRDAVIGINPFDVVATADAIEAALDQTTDNRAKTAKRLKRAATRTTPAEWLRAQLDAANA